MFIAQQNPITDFLISFNNYTHMKTLKHSVEFGGKLKTKIFTF